MAKVIAVTGKGGVGKTLVAALMVKHLRQRSPGPILAVDADPDANLATLLGVRIERTLADVREGTLDEIRKLPAGMNKAAYIEAGLHETLVETEKVDFLAKGRSEGPGCYCYVNNLLRKFCDDLLPGYEWMVMDSEAGMEHLSRQTASKVDHLVVVVNANPLSVDCARRIIEVIASVHNRVYNKHFLLNAVNEDRVEAVRRRMSGIPLDELGQIPYDPAIEGAIFDGRSIDDLDGTPAVVSMKGVMATLGA